MKMSVPISAFIVARFRAIALVLLLVLWASCTRIQVRQGWNERLGPVMPHDTFPAECSLCHIGGDWNTLREDFSFDHEKETGVALTGAHKTAQCLRCHNDRGPVQQFAAQGCAGCHVDVHMGRLGPNCEVCHGDVDWRPREQIALHNRTRFPLVGAHAVVECFECHPGAESGVFLQRDVACVSCHLDDYQNTQEPNHALAGLGTNCQDCHVPVVWRGAGSFAHPSSFQLTGGHSGLNCTECHVGNVFTGLSTDCIACHLDDFQSVDDPDHVASNFSTNCRMCHNTNAWEGAIFNHPSSFPLSGGHGGLDCADCHSGGFTGTSSNCVTCHLSDYQNADDPNHIANGFGTDCAMCHNISDWDDAEFNHRFPINSGPHGGFDCNECHLNPGTPAVFSCIDCHEHDRQETEDDHEDVNGYVYSSPACLNCHPNGEER